MKIKKVLAIIMAVCMFTALAVTVSAEGDGIEIRMGESFTGAKINVAEAGLEEGHTYLMTIKASAGAAGNGFRVRWANEGENEYNDTTGEPAAHSSDTATVKAGENKAYQIPAYFIDVFDLETRNTEKTFYIEFTVGEAIANLSPLYMDYIVIQGQQGNDAYTIHDLTIEEIGGGAAAVEEAADDDAAVEDEVTADEEAAAVSDAATVEEATTDAAATVEDTAAVTVTTAAAGNTSAAGASTKGSADTGVEGIAVVAGLALLAAGAVVISRKRK